MAHPGGRRLEDEDALDDFLPYERDAESRPEQSAGEFVSRCLDHDESIVGYYTFAAASLPMTDLSAEEARRLPRYPLLPAALIVDAKDEAAAVFYEHLQFRRFAGKPASLFLAIATALRAVNATDKG